MHERERQSLWKKKLNQTWILLWQENKNKKTPTKTDFELCFQTHAQTLSRLVLRKDTNQTKFGKDCKCVWYRQGLKSLFWRYLSITVLVILVLKVISSKSPFTVFMKLIFGLCMCGARVRLGSVRIWWLCVNSQHFPSKSSSLNFCHVGWCLLELSSLSGLGHQEAEKSRNMLSTPVGLQPCSGGEQDGASTCLQHLPAAAQGVTGGREKGTGAYILQKFCIWSWVDTFTHYLGGEQLWIFFSHIAAVSSKIIV